MFEIKLNEPILSFNARQSSFLHDLINREPNENQYKKIYIFKKSMDKSIMAWGKNKCPKEKLGKKTDISLAAKLLVINDSMVYCQTH